MQQIYALPNLILGLFVFVLKRLSIPIVITVVLCPIVVWLLPSINSNITTTSGVDRTTPTATIVVAAIATPLSTPFITLMDLPPKAPCIADVYTPGGNSRLPFNDRFREFWGLTGGDKFWGLYPTSLEIREPYNDVMGQEYIVQYFDKGRMERHILSPGTEPLVKSGLLAFELISGHIKLGDKTYALSLPPSKQMFGEQGPSYDILHGFADIISGTVYLQRDAGDLTGAYAVSEISENSAPDRGEIDGYGEAIKFVRHTNDSEHAEHNVPQVFCDFLIDSLSPGRKCEPGANDDIYGSLWDASGFPISEPYWAEAKFPDNTSSEDVMFQAFERRILLFRPELSTDQNASAAPEIPAIQKVSVTNIGVDYYNWRYPDHRQDNCR